MVQRRYMAGSVPRSLRQTRLGHLPFQTIIGSKHHRGQDGSNLVFDIIMLPEPEFNRMKGSVGLRQVMGPAFKADASFQPGFVVQDAKFLIVPDDAADPETFARHYFIKAFGLEAWADGAPQPKATQTPQPKAAEAKPTEAKPTQSPPHAKIIEVEYTVVDYDPNKDKQNVKDDFSKSAKPFSKK